MRMLAAVLLLPTLSANAHGHIINVPGDSTTIQAGIDGASIGDTVLVAEGHYQEWLNFLGKNIVLASEYVLTGDTLAIENTIIDGDIGLARDADTACVIIFCNGESPDAVVEGFTIQNGQGFLNEYSRRLGGGIMCIGASPTVRHNIFSQNSPAHCGGAICCQDSSNAIITHNTFTGNSANYGGAVMCSYSTPVISYNVIVGNSATGAETRMGGGILSYRSSATITHNVIVDNSATLGGGICSYVLNADLISENEIIGNNAMAVVDSGYGGGICCYHTFSGTISDNTIADNTARSGGGGIHLWLSNAIPGEDATIIDNVITGNTSVHFGGAIDLCNFAKGLIMGNLLAENQAGEDGGGMAFRQSQCDVCGNTLAYNSAGGAGGVWAYATGSAAPIVPIWNTILWGNDAPQIGVGGTATVQVTYCDVEGGWPGTGNINCNPDFCDPATGDYYLDVNSCCTGAGQGGADIGAYGVGCDFTSAQDPAGDTDGGFFCLAQNRPNPFSGLTTISYRVPERSHVQLSVYNVLGQKVAGLVDEIEPAGVHAVDLDASRLSAGVYFYRIQMGQLSETKRMTLLK